MLYVGNKWFQNTRETHYKYPRQAQNTLTSVARASNVTSAAVLSASRSRLRGESFTSRALQSKRNGPSSSPLTTCKLPISQKGEKKRRDKNVNMVSKGERKTKPISSAMVGRDEYVHGQLAKSSEVFNQGKTIREKNTPRSGSTSGTRVTPGGVRSESAKACAVIARMLQLHLRDTNWSLRRSGVGHSFIVRCRRGVFSGQRQARLLRSA